MTAGQAGTVDAVAMAEAPAEPRVPAWKLVLTLGLAGALAGLLLVVVYRATQPVIAAHKEAVLAAAVTEVLGGPERWETLYVVGGTLVAEPPAGTDVRSLERVFVGYDAAGARKGFAVAAAEAGFQDVIRLIFGYDPETRQVIGMKVLENKETPGLGDKIEKDAAFTGQFAGLTAPLSGVKAGASEGPGDVDMITGATISSRAVIRIMNHAVEGLAPVIDAYVREGAR